MLLRCLEWRKRKRDDHTLSYADALAKTASESIKAIVRKRRILFAGFVARMGEERLLQRVMFGELVGGKGSEIRLSLGKLLVKLSLGKLLVNLLQVVKRTNIPLIPQQMASSTDHGFWGRGFDPHHPQ